jgi:beta-glucosidase
MPTGACWEDTVAFHATMFRYLKALKASSATGQRLLYSEGCKITVGGSWNEDEVVPGDPEEDRRMIAEAVKVAEKSDLVVLAIGGNEQTSREAWMLNHMGDRTSIDMVGRQDELVKAMVETGKPLWCFCSTAGPFR